MNNLNNVLNEIEIKTQEKLVADFRRADEKAFSNARRDTWNVALIANKISKREDFKKLFGNVKGFAECVGYSQTAMSRMIGSARLLTILKKEDIPHADEYTVGQISEILPYQKELEKRAKCEELDADIAIVAFCKENINPAMSAKEIRDVVKDYKPSKAIEKKDNEKKLDEKEPETPLFYNDGLNAGDIHRVSVELDFNGKNYMEEYSLSKNELDKALMSEKFRDALAMVLSSDLLPHLIYLGLQDKLS